mmetsp:Transcript_12035/g.22259  ORF Transcript_12035/g.22259 Transcript_12035/m.22259 type:complete len:374 (-) Transcript_12035:1601-2722(-)
MKHCADESDSDESTGDNNTLASPVNQQISTENKPQTPPQVSIVGNTRRPGSAESRGTLTAINSMEHASLVIRSLRSFSHSQKSYHRTACHDDKIISTLRQFDQIVIQKSAEVDKAKRVQGLIAGSGAGSSTGAGAGVGVSNKKTATTKGTSVNHDDSSDDEDDDNQAVEGPTGKGQRKKSAQLVWGRGNDTPAERSVEESVGVAGSTRGGGCVVTKHTRGGGDSSDDDLLGGLGSDDDDDMAALMQGFVAPSVSQAAVATTRSLKKERSAKGTTRSSKSSAIHDLEDSMDSGSFPSYLERQNFDDASRSISSTSHTDQSRSQGKKGSTTSTSTGNNAQQRSQSAGNPGGTTGGSSMVSAAAVRTINNKLQCHV